MEQCRVELPSEPRSCGRRRKAAAAQSQTEARPRAVIARAGTRLETHRATGSDLPDRNLLLILACVGRLRQRDRQHAILEARLDPVGVDTVGDAERTVEGAVAALRQIKILLLLFPFVALLALDGQGALGEFDVHTVLLHAGQLGRYLVGALLVDDVDGGRSAPELAAPER